MGSYVQVIIGGMLLVTAFLVGRHINDKPIIVTSALESAESSPINLQASHGTAPENVAPISSENPIATSSSPNQLQKSLRERILGERQKSSANGMNVDSSIGKTTSSANSSSIEPKSPFTLSEQDIVVPDFSNFETTEPDPKPFVETVKKSIGKLTPKSDKKTLPKKIKGDIIVGPIPSNRLAEAPERKIEFQRSMQKQEPRKSANRKSATRRGSLKTVKSPAENRLVAVRHRENRITTETQDFIDYTTVFGDTLHGLSNRFFGKPDFYLDIYLANKDQFKNPSSVPVNKKLRIPLMAELIETPGQN